MNKYFTFIFVMICQNLLLSQYWTKDCDSLLHTNYHVAIAHSDSIVKFNNLPDVRLSVVGPILTQKVLLKGINEWPDYVFEKDYKLMPISKVESYIKKYRTLPGVPSTDDLLANNIEISKITHILLRKIEELTLYLFESEARKKELEKLIFQVELNNIGNERQK